MSDKDAKKTTGESSSSTATSDDQSNTYMPAPIRNVSAILSLENCEKYIEKENHLARIKELRTEGLEFLQKTNWMYQNN